MPTSPSFASSPWSSSHAGCWPVRELRPHYDVAGHGRRFGNSGLRVRIEEGGVSTTDDGDGTDEHIYLDNVVIR